MIEHISYSNGLAMLRECHRILRNNGKIRISTPNLQFLIDLYKDNKSKLQREYIKWAIDSFIKSAPCYDDTFVINNFVRDWGHLFIYDEKTLRSSLEKAGFTKIIRCDLNESKDETLRNLENEKRMPKGFLKLESVTLEGTKVLDSFGSTKWSDAIQALAFYVCDESWGHAKFSAMADLSCFSCPAKC